MSVLDNALTPEQREKLAEQLGGAKVASKGLLVQLGESVRNVREHEHPTWEDLYCLNLFSWMGERMGPVLRRLLDAEARVAELEAQGSADRAAILREAAANVVAYCPEHGDRDTVRITCHCAIADELRRTVAETQPTAPTCPDHPNAPRIGGVCGGCTQYPADMTTGSGSAAELTEGLNDLAALVHLWYGRAETAEARVAELEAALESPLAFAEQLDAKSLDNFLIALAAATEYEPMDGAIDEVHQLIRSYREDSCWPCGCPKRSARHADGCPAVEQPPVEDVTPQVLKLRALLAGQRADAETGGVE